MNRSTTYSIRSQLTSGLVQYIYIVLKSKIFRPYNCLHAKNIFFKKMQIVSKHFVSYADVFEISIEYDKTETSVDIVKTLSIQSITIMATFAIFILN